MSSKGKIESALQQSGWYPDSFNGKKAYFHPRYGYFPMEDAIRFIKDQNMSKIKGFACGNCDNFKKISRNSGHCLRNRGIVLWDTKNNQEVFPNLVVKKSWYCNYYWSTYKEKTLSDKMKS